MVDRRRKNQNWFVADEAGNAYSDLRDGLTLAVLMDIRDELQSINSKMGCYRLPRALDALYEVGQDIRRKKRAAATKRRNAKVAKRG